MSSKKISGKKLRQWILDAMDDAKAKDVITLDVRRLSSFTDYMIIASGNSSRHVVTVADKVTDQLREHGIRPIGREGQQTGDWVLVDFGDVVVHVMREPIRDFYSLEKLWSDAKEVD